MQRNQSTGPITYGCGAHFSRTVFDFFTILSSFLYASFLLAFALLAFAFAFCILSCRPHALSVFIKHIGTDQKASAPHILAGPGLAGTLQRHKRQRHKKNGDYHQLSEHSPSWTTHLTNHLSPPLNLLLRLQLCQRPHPHPTPHQHLPRMLMRTRAHY